MPWGTLRRRFWHDPVIWGGNTPAPEEGGKEHSLLPYRKPDDFDLLITDQSMPGISGIALAEEILQKQKDFPIIIVTGYSTVLKAEEAEEMGVKNILIKPLA